VPFQDTRDLHEIAADSRRVELAEADHLFSAAQTAHVVRTVVEWIIEQKT
jgi:hypothetical protein